MTGLTYLGWNRNWAFYLASGVAVLTASSLLTGCRFGNKVEYAQSTDPSGYYANTPSSLQYCITLEGQPTDGANCRDVLPSSIPGAIGATMTDPVALVLDNRRTDGYAVLMENLLKNAQTQFPIFVEQDKTIYMQASTTPAQFYRDALCQNRAHYSVQGALTPSSVAKVTLSDGSSVTLKGRISAQFQVVETLEGSCGADLQEVAACYQDATRCGHPNPADNQAQQAVIRGIFGPYVDAGALRVEDIPSMLTFGYKVSYE
jgi:hypothetical protein